ncbi:nuclear transport factor 2 family protein [Flavihumibacter sp. R14]|nr:nuclear transport factor 2 family protein [Flavihumibacter soli]
MKNLVLLLTILFLFTVAHAHAQQPSPDPASATADSVLRGMETGYNTGDFQKISVFYADQGKVVGRGVEISGREAMLKYWKDICALGGTWKLSNEKTEKIGAAIWQRGVSLITAKDGKQHKVSFTLVLIQEGGMWKILQDAYW